jgi:hypothetical protein
VRRDEAGRGWVLRVVAGQTLALQRLDIAGCKMVSPPALAPGQELRVCADAAQA